MQIVYFVALPEMLLLDLSGIAEAFRVANQMAKGEIFDLRYVGVEPFVRTSLGLELGPLLPLPLAIEEGAWVVLCGVRNPDVNLQRAEARAICRWLGETVDERQRLCCVCAGALLAADAGFLKGRACTTHHDHCDDLQARHPSAKVQFNRIFVQDGQVFTSAGVTAGIDLALHLIALSFGSQLALKVARDLVVYLRRSGSDAQLSPWLSYRNHLHAAIHRAQDAIAADPTSDWSLAKMAKSAHVSVRTLSRLFVEEAGVTPLDYLQGLRLALARERVSHTSWGLERIALASGFSSAHQLRRVWRKTWGTPPSALRGPPSS